MSIPCREPQVSTRFATANASPTPGGQEQNSLNPFLMRTAALAVALAFSMLLSACAGTQPSQASGGDAANAAPLVAASAAPSQTPTLEPIAALVNGKTIPMA